MAKSNFKEFLSLLDEQDNELEPSYQKEDRSNFRERFSTNTPSFLIACFRSCHIYYFQDPDRYKRHWTEDVELAKLYDSKSVPAKIIKNPNFSAYSKEVYVLPLNVYMF